MAQPISLITAHYPFDMLCSKRRRSINRISNNQEYVFRPSKMQYVRLDNHGWKKETEETQAGISFVLIF
ncbi:MAG: hypothetical protein M3264_12320 [Thermoproteota archaeon]|nr:hypothetical protein [Thermoproteota archaeon]